MEQKTLAFTLREKLKKGPSGRLRRTGKIPSVIYGQNEPVAIVVDEHEFNTKFKIVSESTIITLQSDQNSYDVLVKDYQEDILKGKIIHIDFYEVEKGKLLKTHLPVHFSGTPVGVKEGGLLETVTHVLEIECLPKDLPSEVVIDINDLEVGHSLHVSDVPAIEGVKYLAADEQVICTITRKKAEEEIAEEEIEEEAVGEEEAAAAAEGEETTETEKEE
jgi:large subunit ribosomal protein L25